MFPSIRTCVDFAGAAAYSAFTMNRKRVSNESAFDRFVEMLPVLLRDCATKIIKYSVSQGAKTESEPRCSVRKMAADQRTRNIVTLSLVLCLILPIGCLRQTKQPLTWGDDFLPALTNIQTLARLDVPQTEIVTSFDPAGGNNDYNHFLRKGPKGWVVLADLKGPGVVTRFWMTGADDGKHRVRFYFDGEWRPRMDVTLDDLTGGMEPFVRPLAAYENYCWYSFVPIPYRKRLVIMAQEGGYREGGWPRLFYQINYIPLPRTSHVASLTLPLTEKDRAALERICAVWKQPSGFESETPESRRAVGILRVKSGDVSWLDSISGPGMIQSIRLRPQYDKLSDARARENLLRDVVLQILWDDAREPSVDVPLGDFFGSIGQRTRFESALLGATNDVFISRFPMPFRRKADIVLVNGGSEDVTIEMDVRWTPLPEWRGDLGYFHATWSRTSPREVGLPHPILRAKGRGKYVGCVLGVISEEPSWWILEGDEKMYVDGAEAPHWHGTGLEDYFNGGWYYQNPLARPFHGMTYKVFFRVHQYRMHLLDAVSFDKTFDMTFERGPNHASQGWMESVAYYYMNEPRPAAFRIKPRHDRRLPPDRNAERTIMTELFNYERLNDFAGARDRIDWFLENYPRYPYEAVLRLRQIAYEEYLGDCDAVWSAYQRFIAQETNETALAQAQLLSWIHEKPHRALVSLYATGRSSIILDGSVVCSVDRPDRAAVVGVELKPGEHVLAIQATWQPYPNWVQAAVKWREGMIGTVPDWKYAFNPEGPWGLPDYDDRHWRAVGGTGVKGPPEEPYIWLEPNAFVGLQSLPIGLRVDDKEWPRRDARLVLRKTFRIP